MSASPVPPSPSSMACALKASHVIAGFDDLPQRRSECHTPKASPSLKARTLHTASKIVSPYTINGSPATRNRKVKVFNALQRLSSPNGKISLVIERKDVSVQQSSPVSQSGRKNAVSFTFQIPTQNETSNELKPAAALFQQSSLLNLNELLSSKAAYNHFLAFLKSEYAEENLLFWQAVETFRVNANNETARQIYFEFIKPGAPNEINISFVPRQAIEKALCLSGAISETGTEQINDKEKENNESSTATVVDSSVFDEAQLEISMLMQRDTLPRFQQSPHWFKYLTANQARVCT